MSNIYIQEPPTSGKVLLKTSVGDIDLELWTREAPKACRNFIQLCMEGYYNGIIFHRVVKGFIVQGGDPTGTGEGGESIYGNPFKDEFHTRLRFCRRGLLAMANAGKDDNGSQFFFTLGATPELQNKHTIFGKVTGETIYNMLKLEEAEIDQNERPMFPQRIISTEILSNPFDDIIPRSQVSTTKIKEPKKLKQSGIKNFALLSFGEEAEGDEEESVVLNKQYRSKSKSAHDNLADPKLSTAVAVEPSGPPYKKKKEDRSSDWESDGDNMTEEERVRAKKEAAAMKKRIIDKLKDKKSGAKKLKVNYNEAKDEESSEEEYYFGKDRDDERKKQAQAIRQEIKELKQGIRKEKKDKELSEKKKLEDGDKKAKKSEMMNEYVKIQEKYKAASSEIPKKGVSREKYTMELLKKFRNKLETVKQTSSTENPRDEPETNNDTVEKNDTWMGHVLKCEEKNPILAKDASTKDDDWFEIYDPRNPINKRRRGESDEKKNKRSSYNRSNSRHK